MATATRKKMVEVDAGETVEETVSLPTLDENGFLSGWQDVPLSQIPTDPDGMVNLVARYAALEMPIIPEEWRVDPRTHAPIRVSTGYTLKFHRHRARVALDMLPLIAQHPAFSGVTEEIKVYLEDDPRAAAIAPQDPKVVNGAQSLNPGRQAEMAAQPLLGWDKMNPVDIVKAIAEGRVHDPIGAMAFECRPNGGLRRERVRRALWEASNPVSEGDASDGDLQVGAVVVDEYTGDKVDDTSSSTVPPDARRV